MGVPTNEWFLRENPNRKWMVQGYPYFRKPSRWRFQGFRAPSHWIMCFGWCLAACAGAANVAAFKSWNLYASHVTGKHLQHGPSKSNDLRPDKCHLNSTVFFGGDLWRLCPGTRIGHGWLLLIDLCFRIIYDSNVLEVSSCGGGYVFSVFDTVARHGSKDQQRWAACRGCGKRTTRRDVMDISTKTRKWVAINHAQIVGLLWFMVGFHESWLFETWNPSSFTNSQVWEFTGGLLAGFLPSSLVLMHAPGLKLTRGFPGLARLNSSGWNWSVVHPATLWFPEIRVPPNHPFSMGFSIINQPL